MPKYRWLEPVPKYVIVRGRTILVNPGDVVELPDTAGVQTGKTGEPAQWEPVRGPKRESQSESSPNKEND